MTVENAKLEDAGRLTELRLSYLKEDHGNLSGDEMEKIRRDLPDYFQKHLNRDLFVYLIRDQEDIAACAFLLVIEKPMSPAFMTGRTGTVLNVYTKPYYRHKGYAKQIMERLLADAVEKELSVVELKSTDDGYHLYRSIGFLDDASKYHAMKYYP